MIKVITNIADSHDQYKIRLTTAKTTYRKKKLLKIAWRIESRQNVDVSVWEKLDLVEIMSTKIKLRKADVIISKIDMNENPIMNQILL